MNISHTIIAAEKPDFNTWALGIHNRIMVCNTCKEPFREKSLKTSYVADAGCVSGTAVCPFCGSDNHRYVKYYESTKIKSNI